MDDYKDKQAVIDAVRALPTWYGDAGCLPFGDPQPPMEALLYPEDVVYAIENVPSADVEPIVRCKDCKHRCGDYCHNDDGFAHFDHFFVHLDDYCSRGERMDGVEKCL